MKKLCVFQIILYLSIFILISILGIYSYLGIKINTVNYLILTLLFLYSLTYIEFTKTNKPFQIIISILIMVFFYNCYIHYPIDMVKNELYNFGLLLVWLYAFRFKINYIKFSIFLIVWIYLFEGLFLVPYSDFLLSFVLNHKIYSTNLDYPVLEYSIFYPHYFNYVQQMIIPKAIAIFLGEYFFFEKFNNPIPEKLQNFLSNKSFRNLAFGVILLHIFSFFIDYTYFLNAIIAHYNYID